MFAVSAVWDLSDDDLPDLVIPAVKPVPSAEGPRATPAPRPRATPPPDPVPRYRVQNPLSAGAKQFLKRTSSAQETRSGGTTSEGAAWLSDNVLEPLDPGARASRAGRSFDAKLHRKAPPRRRFRDAGVKTDSDTDIEIVQEIEGDSPEPRSVKASRTPPPRVAPPPRKKQRIVGPNSDMRADLKRLLTGCRVRLVRDPHIERLARGLLLRRKAQQLRQQRAAAAAAAPQHDAPRAGSTGNAQTRGLSGKAEHKDLNTPLTQQKTVKHNSAATTSGRPTTNRNQGRAVPAMPPTLPPLSQMPRIPKKFPAEATAPSGGRKRHLSEGSGLAPAAKARRAETRSARPTAAHAQRTGATSNNSRFQQGTRFKKGILDS